MAEFKDRLNYALKRKDISSADLSRMTGIGEGAISQYRKGAYKASQRNLEKIANALNVSISWLMGLEADPHENDAAPSAAALNLAQKIEHLDARARQMIEALIESELARVKKPSVPKSPKIISVADIPAPKKKTRIIPLIGNGFAAGTGDPDFNVPVEDYEVPAETKADFAIKINGNSMEPYLKNGSIALATKETPRDGDVAALMVDGEFLVKQVCEDMAGNVYLFSLNRKRKDADRVLYADADHTIDCFGTVIMEQVPLPRE